MDGHLEFIGILAFSPLTVNRVLVVSAWLVAVIVTGVLEEALGAVNNPEELTLPAVADQETAWFESLPTVAVNCCVPLAAMVALWGESEM